MEKHSRIYVAGHRGLVGSAIWNNLLSKGYTRLLGRSHAELDLMEGPAVEAFFAAEQPEYVVLAAAHVGGIQANNVYRADFIYRNLQIQQNIIGAAYRHKVKKLLFLGSTCIYPRDAAQPILEEALLTGPLNTPTNPMPLPRLPDLSFVKVSTCNTAQFYCGDAYQSLRPNDNFDLERSHVAGYGSQDFFSLLPAQGR